jgi:hypothetical protein
MGIRINAETRRFAESRRAAAESGKDAFHRVPQMVSQEKWDAVERVLTRFLPLICAI